MDIEIQSYKAEHTSVLRGESYCCCKSDLCQDDRDALACPSICDITISAVPEVCLRPERGCVLDRVIMKTSKGRYEKPGLSNQDTLLVRCYIQEKDSQVYRSVLYIYIYIYIYMKMTHRTCMCDIFLRCFAWSRITPIFYSTWRSLTKKEVLKD